MERLKDVEEGDIPEIDFTGGVRGKYYERYHEGTSIVLLEAEVTRDDDTLDERDT